MNNRIITKLDNPIKYPHVKGCMSHNRIKTGDQALVRQINLTIILDQLRENAPISRADLAEKTGLNKTTVSSLISELISRQLVTEIGLDNAGIGRPSVQLSLNPKAGFVVSAEVGVDFISVISTDFSPHITYKLRMETNPNQDQNEIINQVLILLKNAIKENSLTQDRLLGVALGVPGLVDYETGTLLFAPNLHWKNAELGNILHREFNAPIYVDNEANLAALGEYYFGAAHGHDEVLYISAGAGIGGGIILNGFIMRGQIGFAGEFGHMTMDPEGEVCGCGNRGCWETQASQRALFNYIQNAITHGQRSQLQEITRGDLTSLTVEKVIEAVCCNDSVAIEAFHYIGRNLGIGIASLVNALNPELVVLGGPISLAWDFLRPIIEEQLNQRALRWHRESTRLVLARHGADACVMGGVAAVYHRILARPSDRPTMIALPMYTR
jgi:glucokinase-like ROK family protein